MTARMRGNMTVNAGEFSTFLKELVRSVYKELHADHETGATDNK